MVAPLLATKLYIPPVRPELVPRPRLVARLAGAGSCRLVLVSAAAGFGKTTLVTEWLNRTDRARAWLSLDDGDNDPVRFLTYLVTASQTLDGDIGLAALGLLPGPQVPPLESVATLLINDIAAVARPFVLVLDDYHVVRSTQVHQLVEYLIDHQPPQMQLVLLSRQDPPLPLPRLRVRGQVLEISERDLRFTSEEARDFFRHTLGIDLPPAAIEALEARTEGWIAGLQLASLSLRGRAGGSLTEFVEHFGGSHRHVIDYLADEVLAQQTEEVRDFLCQTSILDRLSAPLCDAVTGRNDGKAMLRHLDEANLFLIPLDDERHWYRYHQLFADFMRTELAADRTAALHNRASDWLAAHGLMPEAVDHAIASGDVTRAARVIAAAAAETFRSGSLATLERWLDALPDGVVRADGQLATFKGCLLFFTGQTGRSAIYAGDAARSLSADAPPAGRGRLLSLQAHLALCAGDRDATVELSRGALACLDESDALFRNLTSNVLGQVLELKGDVVSAAGIYRQAVAGDRPAGDEVGALVVLTNLVFALNELGRRREAVDVCQQAIEDRPSRPGWARPVKDGMYLAWSLLSYEANELERARAQVSRALELAERANIADGVVWGRLILARLHLADGALDQARQAAVDGRRYVQSLDTTPGKATWFSAVEAEASLLQGDLAAAARWAAASGFKPADTPHHWDEFSYFVYVRVLLAQDRLEEALQLLGAMERSASQGRRRRKLITIHLLQAAAHHAAGVREQALARVETALELAAPEGYARAFLDEGPVIVDLLPRAGSLAPPFVSEVLAAAPSSSLVKPASGDGGLVEPLSERELEILRLIAAGMSNPEIARRLYLSLNTVKWHAKNLYGKLGAGSRVEAVTRGQELGLL